MLYSKKRPFLTKDQEKLTLTNEAKQYIEKNILIKKFFRKLCETELKIESKRRKLVNHPKFAIYDTFLLLKNQNEEFFTQNDVNTYNISLFNI